MSIAQNLEKNFVSAVVYVHNNEKQIKYFLKVLQQNLEAHFGKYEIILVNDASTDNSAKIIHEVAEGFENSVVSILKMSYFQGMETSMNAGKNLAIGDFVFEFDSVDVDYEHDLIYEVYKTALTGYDIVSASPDTKKKFSSSMFYSVFNKFSKVQYKLTTESFRVLSRRAINRIDASSTTIPYRKAMYANCGLHTSNISYVSMGKPKKFSNKATGERAALALDSFVYFTNALERLSAIICGVFLCLSIGMGIYIVKDFFSGVSVVEGWLSTVGFLSVGFFGVFALLTIILKYLSVMLNLIFKQQRYLISDIEKVVKG